MTSAGGLGFESAPGGISGAGGADAALREVMFAHLDRLSLASPDGSLSSAAINGFVYDGRQLRLIVQSGIWKPVGLDAALTIRTTYTPPSQLPGATRCSPTTGRCERL